MRTGTTIMIRPACLLTFLLVLEQAAFAAGEIREFDLRTIERLGAQLTDPPPSDSGVPARAKQTAVAALNGKLFNIRYSYAVLRDPDGSGFLVYALGEGPRRGDVVIHGHFRATVNADGTKAERVEPLSKSLLIDNQKSERLPKGYKQIEYVTVQIVGTRPLETLIYASNMLRQPIAVTTMDGQTWFIEKGRITKDLSTRSPKS